MGIDIVVTIKYSICVFSFVPVLLRCFYYTINLLFFSRDNQSYDLHHRLNCGCDVTHKYSHPMG